MAVSASPYFSSSLPSARSAFHVRWKALLFAGLAGSTWAQDNTLLQIGGDGLQKTVAIDANLATTAYATDTFFLRSNATSGVTPESGSNSYDAYGLYSPLSTEKRLITGLTGSFPSSDTLTLTGEKSLALEFDAGSNNLYWSFHSASGGSSVTDGVVFAQDVHNPNIVFDASGTSASYTVDVPLVMEANTRLGFKTSDNHATSPTASHITLTSAFSGAGTLSQVGTNGSLIFNAGAPAFTGKLEVESLVTAKANLQVSSLEKTASSLETASVVMDQVAAVSGTPLTGLTFQVPVGVQKTWDVDVEAESNNPYIQVKKTGVGTIVALSQSSFLGDCIIEEGTVSTTESTEALAGGGGFSGPLGQGLVDVRDGAILTLAQPATGDSVVTIQNSLLLHDGATLKSLATTGEISDAATVSLKNGTTGINLVADPLTKLVMSADMVASASNTGGDPVSIKISGGPVEYHGANTYGGTTTVESAATLVLDNPLNLGAPAGAGAGAGASTLTALTLKSNGTLDLSALDNAAIVLNTLSSSGTIKFEPAAVAAITCSGNLTGLPQSSTNIFNVGANGGVVFSAMASKGTDGTNTYDLILEKTGTGVLTLSSGDSTHTSTTLSAGSLVLGASSTHDGSAITKGPAGLGTLTVAAASQGLDLKGFSLHNPISLGRSLTNSANGDASIETPGPVTLTSNSSIGLSGSASGNLNIKSVISGPSKSLTVDSSATATGKVILGGANDFSGGFVLTRGAVQVGASSVYSSSITSGALGTGSVSIASNGILDFNAKTLHNAFTLAGGTVQNTAATDGGIAAEGSLALTANSSFGVTGAGGLSLGSVISGGYSVTVNSSGAGKVNFGGANLFQSLTVTSGTAQAGAASNYVASLITSGPFGIGTTTVGAAGILDFNGKTVYNSVNLTGLLGNATGTGTLAPNATLALSGTAHGISVDGGELVINAKITGTTGLNIKKGAVKLGSQPVATGIAGINAYSGTTAIGEGIATATGGGAQDTATLTITNPFEQLPNSNDGYGGEVFNPVAIHRHGTLNLYNSSNYSWTTIKNPISMHGTISWGGPQASSSGSDLRKCDLTAGITTLAATSDVSSPTATINVAENFTLQTGPLSGESYYKTGLGQWSLSQNSSYTGTLTIAQGTVAVGSASSLPSQADMILQGTLDATYFAGIEIPYVVKSLNTSSTLATEMGTTEGEALLSFSGNSFKVTTGESVYAGKVKSYSVGQLRAGNGARLTLTGDLSQFEGSMAPEAGGTIVLNPSTTSWRAQYLLGDGVLEIASGKTLNFRVTSNERATSATVIAGSGKVEVSSEQFYYVNNAAFSGASTYSGGLTIGSGLASSYGHTVTIEGPTVQTASSTPGVYVITSSPVGTGTVTMKNDAQFKLNGCDLYNPISAQGGRIWNSSETTTAHIYSPVALVGTSDLQLYTVSASVSPSMVIHSSITGARGIDKLGVGILKFVGDHAYTGATTVTEGTLLLDGDGAFSASSGLALNATLDIRQTTSNAVVLKNLTGGGVNGSLLMGTKNLEVQNSSDNTYAGAFSGTGELKFTGAGSMNLTGNSSGFDGTLYLGQNASVGGSIQVTGLTGDSGKTLTVSNGGNFIFKHIGTDSNATTDLSVGILGEGNFIVNRTLSGGHVNLISTVLPSGEISMRGNGTLSLRTATDLSTIGKFSVYGTTEGATLDIYGRDLPEASPLYMKGGSTLSTTLKNAGSGRRSAIGQVYFEAVTPTAVGTDDDGLSTMTFNLAATNGAISLAKIQNSPGKIVKSGAHDLILGSHGNEENSSIAAVTALDIGAGRMRIQGAMGGVNTVKLFESTSLSLEHNTGTDKVIGSSIVCDQGSTGTPTRVIEVRNGAIDCTGTAAGNISVSVFGAGDYSRNYGLSDSDKETHSAAKLTVHDAFNIDGGFDVGVGGALKVSLANDKTWTNPISGAGSFEKAGVGVMTLNSAISYTGSTTISGGELILGATQTLGASSNVVVNAALNLTQMNGTSAVLKELTGTLPAGSIIFDTKNLEVQNSVANTYAGGFSGTGQLKFTGAGSTALSGDSSSFGGSLYLGQNVHVDGSIQVTGLTGDSGKTLTVNNGGDFIYKHIGENTNASIDLSLGILGTGNFIVNRTHTGGQVNLTSTVLPSGELSMRGNGRLSLTTTNDLSAIDILSVYATTEGSVLDLYGHDLKTGGTLYMKGIATGSGSLENSGTGRRSSIGNLVFSAVTPTESPLGDDGLSTMTFGMNAASGAIKIDTFSGSPGTLNKTGPHDLILGKFISENDAAVAALTDLNVRQGRLRFMGKMEGATDIVLHSGSTLSLEHGTADVFKPIGASLACDGSSTGAPTRTLEVRQGAIDFTGTATGNIALSIYGAGDYSRNYGLTDGNKETHAASKLKVHEGFAITGPVTVGGDLLVDLASNKTWSNTVSGSSSVTKAGVADWTISGDWSGYTGAVTVSVGKIFLAEQTSLEGASSLTLSELSGLDISGLTNGSGTVLKEVSGSAGTTISLGSLNLEVQNATAKTFAGTLSGSGQLKFTGAGSTVLSGDNSAFEGALYVGQNITVGDLQVKGLVSDPGKVVTISSDKDFVFNSTGASEMASQPTISTAFLGQGNLQIRRALSGGVVRLASATLPDGEISMRGNGRLSLTTVNDLSTVSALSVYGTADENGATLDLYGHDIAPNTSLSMLGSATHIATLGNFSSRISRVPDLTLGAITPTASGSDDDGLSAMTFQFDANQGALHIRNMAGSPAQITKTGDYDLILGILGQAQSVDFGVATTLEIAGGRVRLQGTSSQANTVNLRSGTAFSVEGHSEQESKVVRSTIAATGDGGVDGGATRTLEIRQGWVDLQGPMSGNIKTFIYGEGAVENSYGLTDSFESHSRAILTLHHNFTATGAIHIDGILEADLSVNTLWANEITGTGLLRKIGGGDLRLSGNMASFSGGVSVIDGRLITSTTLHTDLEIYTGAIWHVGANTMEDAAGEGENESLNGYVINNNGTLSFGNNDGIAQTVLAGTLNSYGTISLLTDGVAKIRATAESNILSALDLEVGRISLDGRFAGVSSSSRGSITVANNGTLELISGFSYTDGDISVNHGSIEVQSAQIDRDISIDNALYLEEGSVLTIGADKINDAPNAMTVFVRDLHMLDDAKLILKVDPLCDEGDAPLLRVGNSWIFDEEATIQVEPSDRIRQLQEMTLLQISGYANRLLSDNEEDYGSEDAFNTNQALRAADLSAYTSLTERIVANLGTTSRFKILSAAFDAEGELRCQIRSFEAETILASPVFQAMPTGHQSVVSGILAQSESTNTFTQGLFNLVSAQTDVDVIADIMRTINPVLTTPTVVSGLSAPQGTSAGQVLTVANTRATTMSLLQSQGGRSPSMARFVKSNLKSQLQGADRISGKIARATDSGTQARMQDYQHIDLNGLSFSSQTSYAHQSIEELNGQPASTQNSWATSVSATYTQNSRAMVGALVTTAMNNQDLVPNQQQKTGHRGDRYNTAGVLGLYQMDSQPLYVTGVLTYGQHNYDVQRTWLQPVENEPSVACQAVASYDGYEFYVTTEGGWKFQVNDTMVLQPYVGYTNSHLSTSVYQETSTNVSDGAANGYGIYAPAQGIDTQTYTTGVEVHQLVNMQDVQYQITTRMGWSSQKQAGDTSTYTYAYLGDLDTSYDRIEDNKRYNTLDLSFGVHAQVKDNLFVNALYTGNFGTSGNTNTAMLSVEYHLG